MIQANSGNVRRAGCGAIRVLRHRGSATFYVLMEVARSLGKALRAAIATIIVVDHVSDCGAGGFDGVISSRRNVLCNFFLPQLVV